MTEVYVVIIEDRHTDVDAEVYADEHKAVERAKVMAKDSCQSPEDYEEHKIADWIFYASYSCESDSVKVLKKEVK